jgi:hypothetical protein
MSTGRVLEEEGLMFIIVRRPLSLVEPTQLRLIAQGSVSVMHLPRRCAAAMGREVATQPPGMRIEMQLAVSAVLAVLAGENSLALVCLFG